MAEKRFQPGDVVVFRLVETPTSSRMVHAYMGDPAVIAGVPFMEHGQILTVASRPYRVLEDSADVVALFQPEGTETRRWHLKDEAYVANPAVFRGESLRLLFPDKAYDVTLFFDAEGEPPWYFDGFFSAEGLQEGWRQRRLLGTPEEKRTSVPGRFRGWYINVQTPFRRMPYGFDVSDMALDIVVRPDRSWYWKDEDELATAVAKGACSEAQAAVIRRTGEEVVQLIESGRPPFDDSWRRWLPFPREPLADVPDGWQTASPYGQDWPVLS